MFSMWHSFVLVQIKGLGYDDNVYLSLLENFYFKRQFLKCQTAHMTTGMFHLQLKRNLSTYHSVTASKPFPLGFLKIIFRDKYIIKLSSQQHKKKEVAYL